MPPAHLSRLAFTTLCLNLPAPPHFHTRRTLCPLPTVLSQSRLPEGCLVLGPSSLPLTASAPQSPRAPTQVSLPCFLERSLLRTVDIVAQVPVAGPLTWQLLEARQAAWVPQWPQLPLGGPRQSPGTAHSTCAPWGGLTEHPTHPEWGAPAAAASSQSFSQPCCVLFRRKKMDFDSVSGSDPPPSPHLIHKRSNPPKFRDMRGESGCAGETTISPEGPPHALPSPCPQEKGGGMEGM